MAFGCQPSAFGFCQQSGFFTDSRKLIATQAACGLAGQCYLFGAFLKVGTREVYGDIAARWHFYSFVR